MTYSAVGSMITGVRNNLTSFTVAVTPSALGDVLVVVGEAYNGSYGSQFVPSGGGVTTWNNAVSYGVPSAGASQTVIIWWGVITATGSQTLTISGGTTQYTTAYAIQQFNSSVVQTWQNDVFGTAGGQAASGNYPSLAPTADGIYLGDLYVNGGPPTGSTTGYVYANGYDGGSGPHDSFVYYLNVANPTAYSPAWAQGTSDYWGACAVVIRNGPVASPMQIVMVV